MADGRPQDVELLPCRSSCITYLVTLPGLVMYHNKFATTDQLYLKSLPTQPRGAVSLSVSTAVCATAAGYKERHERNHAGPTRPKCMAQPPGVGKEWVEDGAYLMPQ